MTKTAILTDLFKMSDSLSLEGVVEYLHESALWLSDHNTIHFDTLLQELSEQTSCSV